MMMRELVLDLEQDTIEGAIPGLVSLGLVKDALEFLRLLGQGQVAVEGERLAYGDMGGVLYTNDVMKIGERGNVRFVK